MVSDILSGQAGVMGLFILDAEDVQRCLELQKHSILAVPNAIIHLSIVSSLESIDEQSGQVDGISILRHPTNIQEAITAEPNQIIQRCLKLSMLGDFGYGKG